MLKNITEYEIPFLPENFNLTDGHAYRKWSKEEEKIIDNVGDIFKNVNRQSQFSLEEEYITRFLTLGEQTVDFFSHKYLICTSASMAIEIAANYLRLKKLSLRLVEPCFDNIADIFKRHHIPLEPFSDEYFDSCSFIDFLESTTSDAICLVTPNNPTGKTLSKDNFLALLDYCKAKDILLILDCCFRAYLPDNYIFDQYGLLKEAGIKYIVIEDTGKTWPTVELKAPFLAVSYTLYQEIYDIYTDMILHASPFVIKLLSELVKNSIKERLAYTHHIVRTNRESLYKNIRGTILTPIEEPYMSLSWLRVNDMTGFQLKQFLDNRGIHILPGNYFYWSNHDNGSQFVRISLVRDPEIFSQAAILLGDLCRDLAK